MPSSLLHFLFLTPCTRKYTFPPSTPTPRTHIHT
jgi:hypothetical protein